MDLDEAAKETTTLRDHVGVVADAVAQMVEERRYPFNPEASELATDAAENLKRATESLTNASAALVKAEENEKARLSGLAQLKRMPPG